MDGPIDAGPPHDHDVEAISGNPGRPPTDQLFLHPLPIRSAEAGIMHVQQRDPGALVLRGAVDHPQGQFHLFTGTGGEILDRHQDAMHRRIGMTAKVHHHNRAVGRSTHAIHDVAHQPGPQLVLAAGTDQQQIRCLFQRRAAHATGHVLIQPQQRAGGHLQIGSDRLRHPQPGAGRRHRPVQTAAHLLQTRVHHRQGQQQTVATGGAPQQS